MCLFLLLNCTYITVMGPVGKVWTFWDTLGWFLGTSSKFFVWNNVSQWVNKLFFFAWLFCIRASMRLAGWTVNLIFLCIHGQHIFIQLASQCQLQKTLMYLNKIERVCFFLSLTRINKCFLLTSTWEINGNWKYVKTLQDCLNKINVNVQETTIFRYFGKQ